MTVPPFQVLIDEHRDDVYRFLRASVGAHDADDAFQETFIAALRAYPRLRADSMMWLDRGGWLDWVSRVAGILGMLALVLGRR